MLSMVTPANDSSAPLAPATPRFLQIVPKSRLGRLIHLPAHMKLKLFQLHQLEPRLLLRVLRSSSEYKHYFEAKCAFLDLQGCIFLSMCSLVFGFVSTLLLLQNGDFINIIYFLLARSISENYLKISSIVKHSL